VLSGVLRWWCVSSRVELLRRRGMTAVLCTCLLVVFVRVDVVVVGRCGCGGEAVAACHRHCLADICITPSPPQSRQQTPPQHDNYTRWAPHHPTCSASPSSSTSPHPPTRHRLPRGPCPSTSPSAASSMPRITATFRRVRGSGFLVRDCK